MVFRILFTTSASARACLWVRELPSVQTRLILAKKLKTKRRISECVFYCTEASPRVLFSVSLPYVHVAPSLFAMRKTALLVISTDSPSK